MFSERPWGKPAPDAPSLIIPSVKTLFLIDASSFIYRSYFALPPLTTSDGFPTGAVYGFLRALLSIIKGEKPRFLAVVFDSPLPSKREKVYREYKAGRPPTPDPLKVQIPVIKRILKLMSVPVFEVPGYEADDILAVLARKFSARGFRIRIYTPDKDMLQLVSDRVVVINPMTWEVFTPEKVEEKFGVSPQRIPDYLALVGDKIDNIPGVKGVGPKTAIRLIEEFGSVEEILARWEEFQKRFPQAQKESLRLSYELVKPITDVAMDISEEDMKLGEPDMRELSRELERLEMKSILRDLEKAVRGRSQGSLF